MLRVLAKIIELTTWLTSGVSVKSDDIKVNKGK
jgi:hypothetical protein